MNKSARDYLALPLDNCAGLDTIRSLVDATRESVGIFKIGLEQFTRYEERFMGFVLAALGFLALEKILSLTRLGRLP